MLTLFVRVTSMYAGEGMDNHYFTEVHDIYVKDLKCKKVNVAALVLQGTEEKPIYNVTFDNVDVDKAGIRRQLGFLIVIGRLCWGAVYSQCERWYIR